jgi:hypothetical protein
MRSSLKLAYIASLILTSAPALADSISPSSFSGTTTVGGSITLSNIVTVNAGVPTGAQADIFFLTDTTGSMGGTIDTVKANFTSIASSISGNIAFGAGQFKDTGDAFAYQRDADITTDVTTAQTAINSWYASGGGDLPEQGLYALGQVATTTSWREGSKRIVVMAGDATAHEDLATVESTAATLAANGVTVESIDVGNLNGAGQFSGPDSIYANGASGEYFTSFGDDLVSTIQAAIGSAFSNYNNVTLQVLGAEGVAVSFTPNTFTGTYDRSVDRNFGFDLTFTGLTAGLHNFTINALVDGGIVASSSQSINVLDLGGAVPEPASWAMMIAGFGLVGGAMRRRGERLAYAV